MGDCAAVCAQHVVDLKGSQASSVASTALLRWGEDHSHCACQMCAAPGDCLAFPLANKVRAGSKAFGDIESVRIVSDSLHQQGRSLRHALDGMNAAPSLSRRHLLLQGITNHVYLIMVLMKSRPRRFHRTL
jgi:hypothetical protein